MLFVLAASWSTPKCLSLGQCRQFVANPYSGTIFSNMKEHTVDTCHNIDEF